MRKPHLPHLSYAVRAILPTMAALLAWDVFVTVANRQDWPGFDGIALQYSLFGTAIALFVGFMVNAAYARWWEARTLFGFVINDSRSLARQAVTLIGDETRARDVVANQIAYADALRLQLHGDPPSERATLILLRQAKTLRQANQDGVLNDYAHIRMESTLTTLTTSQGGLERIANTPLPIQYRTLPGYFAKAFCAVLPFAVVGDLGWLTPIGSGLVGLMFLLSVAVGLDLADPFSNDESALPLGRFTDTIRRDLSELA